MTKTKCHMYSNRDAGKMKVDGGKMIRQDSNNMSAHSSMSDVSVDEGNNRSDSSSPTTPQYALRLTADAIRPTATVLPQVVSYVLVLFIRRRYSTLYFSAMLCSSVMFYF